MIKALFYKEWIKTRGSVLLVIAIMAGLVAYTFINSSQGLRVSGAVQVWNAVITKDAQLMPGIMQWLPALAAVLLSLTQFVPEMTNKRLKLTLHLPRRENTILTALIAYGLTVLTAVYLLAYAALIAGFSVNYPAEMVSGMAWRSLPWFLGGLCAYLLTAWVCLEPVWKHRILYAVAGVCMCSLFFLRGPSGAYIPFMPYLIAFTLACFTFPFYSAARFKDGAQ